MEKRQLGKSLWWLLLIIAAGLGAWWYFEPQALPQMLQAARPEARPAVPTLYKWRDAKGRLNITDQPPSDRPYEAVKYDPNTNVVPSVLDPALPPPAPPPDE